MARVLYLNPLSCEADVKDFVLEGKAEITFANGNMRMKNLLSREEYDQKANYVFWCPEEFCDGVKIEWEFTPIYEPGLCMILFATQGMQGESIFAPGLKPRTGEYDCYLHGDINLYHLSYFRRGVAEERAFHTCQLRKSAGGHRLAAAGDPIPNVEDCIGPYRMALCVQNGRIRFSINEMTVIDHQDDGAQGAVLRGGKIGFRQMAPTVGEYKNLKVTQL